MKKNCIYYSFLIFFTTFSAHAQWRDSLFASQPAQFRPQEYFAEMKQFKIRNTALNEKVKEQDSIIVLLNKQITGQNRLGTTKVGIVMDHAMKKIQVHEGATLYLQGIQPEQIINKGTIFVTGQLNGPIKNFDAGQVIEHCDREITIHNNLPATSNDFFWGVVTGFSLCAVVGGLTYVAHTNVMQK